MSLNKFTQLNSSNPQSTTDRWMYIKCKDINTDTLEANTITVNLLDAVRVETDTLKVGELEYPNTNQINGKLVKYDGAGNLGPTLQRYPLFNGVNNQVITSDGVGNFNLRDPNLPSLGNTIGGIALFQSGGIGYGETMSPLSFSRVSRSRSNAILGNGLIFNDTGFIVQEEGYYRYNIFVKFTNVVPIVVLSESFKIAIFINGAMDPVTPQAEGFFTSLGISDVLANISGTTFIPAGAQVQIAAEGTALSILVVDWRLEAFKIANIY